MILSKIDKSHEKVKAIRSNDKETKKWDHLLENSERCFVGESSGTQSHQCVVAWIIRQRERVKLRSWLTGSRLTWHRPETRFERSNRILAPQLRGYVRRKVRQPGGESRITRQLCRKWGRERKRKEGGGEAEKSGGKMCAQPNKIPENTRLLIEKNIIHVVCAAFSRSLFD